MADTDLDRAHRAEQQKARRLARRTCGYCDRPAETMLPWSGQQIPICGSCQAKLDGPEAQPVWCAFNEIHPRELQAQAPVDGIMIEARLLPMAETPAAERRSLLARLLGKLGQIFRSGPGRSDRRAITGE